MAVRHPLLLRARVLVPGCQPPLDDGAILVRGDTIAAAGRWRDLHSAHPATPMVDLGERILLPGLVNAHCHLDYTDMAGLILPTKDFTDWIKSITTLKMQWSDEDFARSWLHGAQMLVRHGTTTVGDIEAIPALLPKLWEHTPLRVCSYLEMTGVKSRRQPALILKEALDKIATLPSGSRVGLSPHAPYSTTPALLSLCAAAAKKHRLRLAIHIAESALENDMFLHAAGVMHDWLQRNERDMADCGQGSPVQHLERQGLLSSRLLAVHANYLAPGDADLLARRGTHVVHCPLSHAYFKHTRFPFHDLAKRGVNICLGTDSLATTRKQRGQPLELNLFAEMRAFAKAYPNVAPVATLHLATSQAAQALGLPGRAGVLAEGAWADAIAIPHTGSTSTVYDAIVHHTGPISASMIGGVWAIDPAAQS